MKLKLFKYCYINFLIIDKKIYDKSIIRINWMKGSYLINIYLKKDTKITVGRLGNLKFHKGNYIYVGSALNGFEQRINRHLRKMKKIHWHIDYLLKYGQIINVFYKESEKKEECLIAKKLNNIFPSIPDFGCSDCNCESHLFYDFNDKFKELIGQLDMKTYFCDAKH